jgi:hypothetical protein
MAKASKVSPSRNQSRTYPIHKPLLRPLKAYAFDPSQGRLLGNEMSLNVRYEELNKGPVVRNRTPDAIAIVDYDGTNKVWYPPVDLDDPVILIANGLDPSESDPRFHQQMVYAVVTDTIQHSRPHLVERSTGAARSATGIPPTARCPAISTPSTSIPMRWPRRMGASVIKCWESDWTRVRGIV